MTENELVIKQPPLKGITVNVVIRLLLSDFQRPKDHVIISYGKKPFFGCCYHPVKVISHSLAKNGHIKLRLLFKTH